MKHTHWVIIAEWCVDYEGGHSVIGVYHSENAACEALQKRINTDDRLLAEEYGYEIYEDTPHNFDSGKSGEYSTNHIAVSICKIESEDERIVKRQVDAALQCLIDNGIDKDESATVLQALCYILMDKEIDDMLGDKYEN